MACIKYTTAFVFLKEIRDINDEHAKIKTEFKDISTYALQKLTIFRRNLNTSKSTAKINSRRA